MSTWDLNSSNGRLRRAVQKLHDRWEIAQEHWDDIGSREFAVAHLDPILPKLKGTLAAVEKLNEVLENGRRAVEDPEASN